MQGLHIYNRNLFRGRCENRIDYHFRDLCEPTEAALSPLYWVMLDEPVLPVSPFDGQSLERERYEGYMLQKHGRLRLFRRGFLPAFAKFIQGGWVQLYGFAALRELDDIEAQMIFFENRLSPGFVASSAQVYFSCYKGAYWEVFAQDEQVLRLIADRFPNHVEIVLH
ncbi:MAG: hypothetical protein NC924_08840 [Candidatus Omnitrophica bacterium]|nr:hypothetical protein [Candidatus Omnitrophota bacterium]